MNVLAAVTALQAEANELHRAEAHARNCREVAKAAELMAQWYEKKQELNAIYKLLKR